MAISKLSDKVRLLGASIKNLNPTAIYNKINELVDTVNNSAPTYKVYTALLTQNGDGTSTQTSGLLIVGARYVITTYIAGDDFSNVANVISGTINTTGCEFIATGTTPTDYSNESILTDTAAPITTVLENTLGDIVWSYDTVGNYKILSNGLFTSNKTYAVVQLWADDAVSPRVGIVLTNTVNELSLLVRDVDGTPSDTIGLGSSFLTSIEIRVYN